MEACSLCYRVIPQGEPSIWYTKDGQKMSVGTDAEPLVLIEGAAGELWVCETCYVGGLPSSLTSAQQRDTHDQFAMEYRELHRFHEAISACEHALEFGDSADTFAELAFAHSELKHFAEAEAFYRQALALVPDHFMARENLKAPAPKAGLSQLRLWETE